MTFTTSDPKLKEYAAAHPGETIEIVADDGTRIGTFTAHGRHCLPPGVKSPFTDEEMAELRKQRGGRKLADIMRDLKERDGA
jgi:hypothetical protein